MQTKRFRWTKDEDEVIRKVYADIGMKETYRILCETCGNRHSWESFRTRIYDLNLNVTKERWKEACQNNGKHPNVPVGTIVTRGRGENWIKVSDGTKGWMPYKTYLLGKQKGNIVHLDGNKANDDVENLAVVDRKTGARMTAYKFWNENPIITKTAIMACQLETLVEGSK